MIPGRSTPPMPERLPRWYSRPETKVPPLCPAPGCTTIPAGLFNTARTSPSKRISSGISSACADSHGVTAGWRHTISSSARTICEAFAGAPLSSTPAKRITAWIRARETAGKHSDNQRSRRLPAVPGETLKIRCPGSQAGEFLCEKITSTG